MLYKFIFALIALSIVTLLSTQLVKIEKEKNKIIKVQITLDNKCDFFDKVFMVKAVPSGKTAKFINKKTEMFLKNLVKYS